MRRELSGTCTTVKRRGIGTNYPRLGGVSVNRRIDVIMLLSKSHPPKLHVIPFRNVQNNIIC